MPRVSFGVGWIWLAVAINVAAGLKFSASTSLTTVKVIGATEDQQGHIRRAMSQLRGKPAGLVNPHEIRTRLLADQSVLRVDWQQNVFGRGKLRVTPQRPVAVVDSKLGILMAATGELYLGQLPTMALPRVVLPPNAGRASLTFIGNWPAGRIADLCDAVTKSLPENSWKVVQENGGRVAIISGEGARVILGSTERLQEKVAALRAALDENPKLLSQIAAINLSAESNPVILPRGSSSRP